MLEAFHGHADPKAVETAWPYLANPDRFIRSAARVAIEFQDPATWREKALAETNPTAALEALLALTQVSAADPAHRPRAPRARQGARNQNPRRPRPARLGRPPLRPEARRRPGL